MCVGVYVECVCVGCDPRLLPQVGTKPEQGLSMLQTPMKEPSHTLPALCNPQI